MNKEPMINKKFITLTLAISAFLILITCGSYYVFFFEPTSDIMIDSLGYINEKELIFVFIIFIAFSIPVSVLLLISIDIFTDFIYPKKWINVTLVKKHKDYQSYVAPRGTGVNSYRYWFEFLDETGNSLSYNGSVNEYYCMQEGVKIKILVKGQVIRDMALLE